MFKLDRPLAVFDIEATGLNIRTDRLIDLAIVKVAPDGSECSHAYRVNPGMPIPPEVTAIHGISDDDVVDCPRFEDVAREVDEVLRGCDFAGYNVIHYDIPLLTEEFSRASLDLSMDDRRVFDAQKVYHRMEPRDLSAAVRYFCGDDHTGAHTAEADCRATLRVMEAQLERYPSLPTNMDDMDSFCHQRKPEWVDRAGRLKWASDGRVVINFGKNQGKALQELTTSDPQFLRWIVKSNFPRDTREIVFDALDGKFPERTDAPA